MQKSSADINKAMIIENAMAMAMDMAMSAAQATHMKLTKSGTIAMNGCYTLTHVVNGNDEDIVP